MDITIVGKRIVSAAASERPRIKINGASLTLPTGSVVLPGFVDTHCHLIGIGLMASRVSLRDAGSAEECARRIAGRARSLPAGRWVRGFGWNQELWKDHSNPHRDLLDRYIPDHPVVLQRVDSHASWINSRAIEQAGITSRPIAGGNIEIDGAGELTGLLVDSAAELVEQALPRPTFDEQVAWLKTSIDECVCLGITEVHDMNVESERLGPMAHIAAQGDMLLRCNVFLSGMNDDWRRTPQPGLLARNLDVVGVKYFADGALGSRGAFLLEPYSDDPSTSGIPMLDAAELADRACEPIEAGFAIATHAIGDAANRLVLDAYQKLRGMYPEALLRIEHAQIVHPDDISRFQRYNVIPAMQAIHCTSDAVMAESRIGEQRCRGAYAWNSLRASGRPILGGSDFPIESPDPLLGLRAFRERRPFAGGRAWYGAERLNRHDSLAAYTEWAPLGVPSRPNRGRLQPGYDADIVVLDSDLWDNPSCKVIFTIVGGRVVYEASAL